jgi:transposase-like protein
MSRSCSVCAHPDVVEIDRSIAAGEGVRAVARRHEVGEAALRRHRRAHTSAPGAAPPGAMAELDFLPPGAAPRTLELELEEELDEPPVGAPPGPPPLPKLTSRAAATAFAADPSAPPGLRSLEAILVALEAEAKTARSDTARLRALDMLTALLPPPAPDADAAEPTASDARRLCRELFGEGVEPFTPAGGADA